METFTRKKPTNEMLAGEMSLKNLVESLLPHAVTEVVDTNLRINIKEALAKLKKIKLQFQNNVGAPK
ncbi:hypothetical protein Pint_16549 [Pistacia integerrima]|uniref:Uncharacterized protein n=1 Tax=Pistacia integerrima TaxID=434235 RepID=A0ACC0Z9W7_9ROSI|nr:hypothetical protein Pint_16549 [Pistacia integerrima]